MPSEYL